MKKYRYFTILSENDNCAFFKSHNYEIDISIETGDRFVDYQEIFYSKKLKDLIEELDINNLIKFEKVVFSDGIDREYYFRNIRLQNVTMNIFSIMPRRLNSRCQMQLSSAKD